MNTPAPSEEEFRLRLRQATRARRSWVSASEVAGDLCHAAKALKKIADPERRFDCLCDFIFRGGEMLKRVDDSNASLQSVFWDGDVASQIWDATAPLVSDKGKIVRFLLKLYDDGWDRIVFQSVLDWNRLYLPADRLAELRDAVFDRIGTDALAKQHERDVPARIWAQCGDVARFDEYVRKTLRLRTETVWQSRLVVLFDCKRWEEAEGWIRKCAPAHTVRHYLLDLARKRGDGDALVISRRTEERVPSSIRTMPPRCSKTECETVCGNTFFRTGTTTSARCEPSPDIFHWERRWQKRGSRSSHRFPSGSAFCI